MKFTCTTKEIAAAVAAASKVVNVHTTVPVLSNILFTTQDGKIAVRATDLELTLEQAFPAEVQEPGSVTVPARLFSSFLANLAPGALELSGSPTRVSVKVTRSNYDFHALPPDEYPPLPPASSGVTFSLPVKSFRDAVTGTIFAASNEEARGAVLMGTLLEVEGTTLRLVATDGYRLAKYELNLNESVSVHERFIVPSRALGEAARNLGNAERVTLTALGTHSNQLRISAGDMTLTVRLVDGQYPNYGQVIPAKFDRSIQVNTEGLKGALKRAQLVAGDRASMVKLAVTNHILVVTASSDISGNAYEELEVEQSGDDLTIAFNARYLVDILDHIETPQTAIEFLGPLSPAAIRPAQTEQGSNLLYVLMPLRQ